MAKPLEKRIEEALESIFQTALPSAQILLAGEKTKAGNTYLGIRVIRMMEDPPGGGVFLHDAELIAHGDWSADDLNTIDLKIDASYDLAAEIRTAGADDFEIPAGNAVELNAGNKTGVGLDLETRWNFGVWAQAQEIADAA